MNNYNNIKISKEVSLLGQQEKDKENILPNEYALPVLVLSKSSESLEKKEPKTKATNLSFSPENIDKKIIKIKAEEEAAKRRLECPVSTNAIVMQAKLHQAIRQAKVHASLQNELNSEGESINLVYKIGKQKSYIGTDGKSVLKNSIEKKFFQQSLTSPAAFFKIGKYSQDCTYKMENLIWDFSLIMGLESFFVPTGITKISYNKEPHEAKEAGDYLEENLKYEHLSSAKTPIWGFNSFS